MDLVNTLDELGWGHAPDREEDWSDDDEEGGGDADFTIGDLVEHCLLPTVRDACLQFAVVLLWCVVFRGCISLLRLPKIPAHLLSAIFGLIALSALFGESLLFFPAFATIGYGALAIAWGLKKWRGIPNLCGPLSALVCVASIICYEFFFADPVQWHTVRGAQMLVVMKVVSLGFDMDSGATGAIPNASEFYGYVLHVGSVVFGPWIPFKDYSASLEDTAVGMQWILGIVRSTSLSMVCFSISSCFSIYLGSLTSWKWWLAYVDALSYRMSHYFISFMSEATIIASGVGSYSRNGAASTANSSTSSGSGGDRDSKRPEDAEPLLRKTWRYPVSRPTKVEIPRSLVEVVVYWNIPMHIWLKNYVFKPSRRMGFGGFPAIILTYFASAVLHGLNAQLWAVLLSLGFCTYAEHVLREKLSRIYDACVAARPCKEKCDHSKTSKTKETIAWNLGFFFLAVWSLAYLGVMFDSDPKLQEQGYDFAHTFAKWFHLNFTGHWIAISMYTMYYLL